MRRAQWSRRSGVSAALVVPALAAAVVSAAACRPFVRPAHRRAIVPRAPSSFRPRLSTLAGGRGNRRACCARRREGSCPGGHQRRVIFRSRCHLPQPPICAAVPTNSLPPAATAHYLLAPRRRPTEDQQRKRQGRRRLLLVPRSTPPT